MGRRHRKEFPCGHRGFGQTCHQCRSNVVILQTEMKSDVPDITEQKQIRQAWRESFAADPIDLTELPKKVVLKARQILQALEDGADYRQFDGKRFHFDRSLISIPVNYSYRLICRDEGGKPIPLKVVSHETYNAIARNQKH